MKKKNTELCIDPQGWFKNKNEALKQFIERTNKVLRENIIVGDKNPTNISKLNRDLQLQIIYMM